jgi:uncharacterized protein YdaU (DUF1376 family)
MSKEAKPDTWMPLVIGDYLKDTGRLTTEQHGAYLLIIMDYWTNGPPADDASELQAITGLDAKAWRKNRDKLARFFRIEDGVWRHKRIDQELERWTEKKAIYVARAAAGGRAKAAKSTASSTQQAAIKQQKSTEKSCLNPAPQPASTEVDALIGQSTLCAAEGPEARHEGASGLRLVEPDDSEYGWLFDAAKADQELILARRQDPDRASELAEFIAYARARAAELKRTAA